MPLRTCARSWCALSREVRNCSMSQQNAMPPAPPGGEARRESGLVGGIFNKRDHDSIRVKFTDVDWATIVRAGGVTQSEVSKPSRSLCALPPTPLHLRARVSPPMTVVGCCCSSPLGG